MNDQLHKSQLGNKMIEGKGNNMGKVKDMGVINQGKEKTRWKNVQRTTQSLITIVHQKGPSKRITLTHAHK
jgi:hypothetical protein